MHIVIVGGSSGIGRTVADQLRHSHRLVLMQRTDAKLEGTQHIELDLRWPKDRIDHAVDAAGVYLHRRINALVISGGVGAFSYPVSNADRVEELFETNTIGPRYVFNAALPYLKRGEGSARVLYISSTAARTLPKGLEDYAASKAAAEVLFRSFGKRYAKWGIRSNVLRVGWVESPMTGALKPEIREAAVRSTAIRRFGRPDEVAHVVRDILNGPDYWNGDVIELSGGL
jgi:3-oxoacyl-[acyl-carrier protein] reductase